METSPREKLHCASLMFPTGYASMRLPLYRGSHDPLENAFSYAKAMKKVLIAEFALIDRQARLRLSLIAEFKTRIEESLSVKLLHKHHRISRWVGCRIRRYL